MKQQDTQVKLGCTIALLVARTQNIHDVAPASSLKSTELQQNHHTSLLKEQNQQGHLLIVLWI